jgi:hypothetical protein
MCSRLAFLRCIGLSGFGFVFTTSQIARAIPQNFNQGGFFLRTGVTFENFATEDAAFAPGGVLKGEWTKQDARGAQKLVDDAVVFGLPAARVSLERDTDSVCKYVVIFDDEPKGAARLPLLDRVTQNITAFTGDSHRAGPHGQRTFRHGHVQIEVRAIEPRKVMVEFTPLP